MAARGSPRRWGTYFSSEGLARSDFGQRAWLRVILTEGRKRQIRETGSLIGLPVVKIIRIRIGTLHLGNQKPGEWRVLSSQEVDALKGIRKVPGVVRECNTWRAIVY